MQIIDKYFDLTEDQRNKFLKFKGVFLNWNDQINLISRKDTDNFYERHVLHSLGIACVNDFVSGTKILDVGTGGGFPGLPLAILYPECHFVLVDSIEKKTKVVKEIVEVLNLKNVEVCHKRVEKEKRKFDFIVSRAVTKMNPFTAWVSNNISEKQINPLPNGILYLKGGDLSFELEDLSYDYDVYPLSEFFEEPFFETKKVVYVRMV